MEAQATLVGAQSAAGLDKKAAVDVDVALVVLPGHAEHDLAVRLAQPLDDLLFHELGVLVEHGSQRADHFADRLVELALTRISRDHLFADIFDVCVGIHRLTPPAS
jgi:hypothetical protein